MAHPLPDSPPVLLAVDGNSLVHRSFHAQAATGARTEDGRPCWAVRGLLAQLVAAVERTGAHAVVVGFDDPDTSWRRERWPQYKAARVDKLDTLVDQLALAAEVLTGLGLAVVTPTGLEADDVLASAARTAPALGARTVVVTSDRDAFALIDETTSVLRIINGGVEASPLLTPARLETMLGVRPEQYRDFAALRGDPSDNLPGVRGIGPKTAARLLSRLGSAAAAFDDVATGGTRTADALGRAAAARLADPAARAAWELNCQVMAMRADLSLELDLSSGPGVLPLTEQAVTAAFAAHHLPWTTAAALRVLAHVDGPVRPVTIADTRRADRPEVWSQPPRGSRRPPPLARASSASSASSSTGTAEQLSLFD